MLKLLLLLASQLAGITAQGCARANTILVEGATYNSLSLAQCQLYCQQNPQCTYFTWNTQTQGCGIRTYSFSGFLDAQAQYTGTPYSGAVANKAFVGRLYRSTQLSNCASNCQYDYYCKSWTWYTDMMANMSNICVMNYEQPTLEIPVTSPTPTSLSTTTSALYLLYSGPKSCYDSSYDQCSYQLSNNLCCTSSLPFIKNCGYDQNGTSGIIQSPNYPSPYGNGVACIWNINAPADTVINITITNFLTEYNDKLFVFRTLYYCNTANETFFSGSLSPRSFLVPENKAAVYFYSDASGSLSGFNLNWIAYSKNKAGCGANVSSTFVKNCGIDQTGDAGSILSPNFPSAYGNNVQCGWNITGPAGSIITLNITSFYTENSADKLYIFWPQNCSSVVGKELSGSLSPQIVNVPQNQVSLYFVSDNNVSYSGFNINWSALTTCTSAVTNITGQSFVKNCGGILNGTSGTIQSPNYPSNYGNNNYCEWTITAPPGTNIVININAFNTEANYDRLFILHSATCAQVVPNLSGSAPAITTPRRIPIGKNAATVFFYSDGSVVSSGFSLTWSVEERSG